MAKNKTVWTEQDVTTFLDTVADTKKRSDSDRLIEIMSSLTDNIPKMWGPSIIGFGKYQYTYASGHQGEAPLIGFSPRKPSISLYIFSDTEEQRALLQKFGKFKMGKACIYVKQLQDIDEDVLAKLIELSIEDMTAKHSRLE